MCLLPGYTSNISPMWWVSKKHTGGWGAQMANGPPAHGTSLVALTLLRATLGSVSVFPIGLLIAGPSQSISYSTWIPGRAFTSESPGTLLQSMCWRRASGFCRTGKRNRLAAIAPGFGRSSHGCWLRSHSATYWSLQVTSTRHVKSSVVMLALGSLRRHPTWIPSSWI